MSDRGAFHEEKVSRIEELIQGLNQSSQKTERFIKMGAFEQRILSLEHRSASETMTCKSQAAQTHIKLKSLKESIEKDLLERDRPPAAANCAASLLQLVKTENCMRKSLDSKTERCVGDKLLLLQNEVTQQIKKQADEQVRLKRIVQTKLKELTQALLGEVRLRKDADERTIKSLSELQLSSRENQTEIARLSEEHGSSLREQLSGVGDRTRLSLGQEREVRREVEGRLLGALESALLKFGSQ